MSESTGTDARGELRSTMMRKSMAWRMRSGSYKLHAPTPREAWEALQTEMREVLRNTGPADADKIMTAAEVATEGREPWKVSSRVMADEYTSMRDRHREGRYRNVAYMAAAIDHHDGLRDDHGRSDGKRQFDYLNAEMADHVGIYRELHRRQREGDEQGLAEGIEILLDADYGNITIQQGRAALGLEPQDGITRQAAALTAEGDVMSRGPKKTETENPPSALRTGVER